ncbi:hypothetical protein DOY81_014587 [Sarcophaga bullata]|nr:hypothetical protein DOY81_014587 [Sarcophaga bullata]
MLSVFQSKLSRHNWCRFCLKSFTLGSNTIVRLQLWDIAGQERFGNMTRVYYKEAVGAFIVFDVTRSGTFDCVSKWKED